MGPIMIAVVVAIVMTAAITWPCAITYRKKVVEARIGNAEDRAREIIDEALKAAETKKRESLLEVKEESVKTRNELEKETKERRAELQRYERRVLSKEEALDKKTEQIERREASFTAQEEK
ncbi:MAG: Rnase Y domain-containing protein, partial [Lachnospiraceae bacterium]|nr:Rnase Y domain-containing protein [Lachnospiraceae bacterium]